MRRTSGPSRPDGADRPDGGEAGRARAVRLALERLGPFYVKIGQMLSTRPDLVSAETRAELALLHDRVSAAPFAMFEPVLAAELGAGWERRFAHIDRSRPLGSASLAQAYRAVLRGGEPVVLKIQRPDIRSQVLADMRLMRRARGVLGRGGSRDLNGP
ncbi:AarF/UbiB family protein [Actinomadura sp. CNU-125]|uniref:AarF/UbiB family protein n=1 Tax=Actinomadura sp. CNU-125 TaxID=1904961 RepID=UPI000A6D9CA4|nr:AarF/UbiB family protein [Actinomadura sp. CNU-125]